MAAPDLSGLLYVPGELIANPANLTTAPDYGGTRLGLANGIAVFANQGSVPITSEEFGVEVVEVIELERAWSVSAALRGFDDDAINTIFPNTALGGGGGRCIRDGGTGRAGTKGSARSITLLYAPKDATNKPGLILHNAIPLPDESLELELDLDIEGVIGVTFIAIRDGSDRTASIGLLADMAL